MVSKARQMVMFLLPGMILAIGTIYAIPMQQAMASCGGGCDGGGKKGGGSLINVQDNNIGNVKDNNVKVYTEKNKVLSNNKVNVLSHDKILSNNKIKDVNVLSKNDNKFYTHDFNVLSKNGNNKIYNHDLIDLQNNIGKHNNFDIDVLNDYYKKMCGC